MSRATQSRHEPSSGAGRLTCAGRPRPAIAWFSAALLGAALLFGAACQRPRAAPPLPDIPLNNFSGPVLEAISSANEQARRNPDDPAATGNLGVVLHAHAQYTLALACYQRALALADSFDWHYYSALALEKLGRQRDAIAAYERALKLRPDAPYAQLRRAELLLDAGRPADARPLLDDLLKTHASLPRVHYALGRVQQSDGDAASALASFRKAVELYPAYGPAHYALAQLLRKQGEEAEARRHLELHREFQLVLPALDDPAERELVEKNAGALALIRMAAQLDLGGGDTAQAIDYLNKALAADPSQVQAHINLLILHGRAGRHDEALRHFEEAVRLAPNRADAYYNLGVLEFSRRRLPAAQRAFERAIAINPQYAEAHNNLAFCLESQGDLRGAGHHFREAVRLHPNYSLALFHLGRILHDSGRRAEAAQFFARARDAATARNEHELAAAAARALGGSPR